MRHLIVGSLILSGRIGRLETNEDCSLVLKLACGVELAPEDRTVLRALAATTRVHERDSVIVAERVKPGAPLVLLDGFAFSCRKLADGRRHITGYVLPGDIIGADDLVLKATDHAVIAVSRSRLATLPVAAMQEATANRPVLHRAFRWATRVEQAVAREWLISLGRRSAEQKIAHLFCELLLRLQLVGRATADSFDLPVTQEEIGETMGLSTVHVNRTLQLLRNAKLVQLQRKRVTLPDFAGLAALGGFSADYLHIHHPPPTGTSTI